MGDQIMIMPLFQKLEYINQDFLKSKLYLSGDIPADQEAADRWFENNINDSKNYEDAIGKLSETIKEWLYTDGFTEFFGKEVALTVSGQLEGECMAMAFGKIYTFGPTFRAENSNTAKHAAEFSGHR